MIAVHEDGVSHINIYSKGATELGRLLSNFARTPFEHPIFGKFESMEGYWYYVKTGFLHPELRYLHGHSAKATGKQCVEKYKELTWGTGLGEFPHFQEAILDGIRCKLRQHRRITSMLAESVLPFEHYYFYGEKDNARIIEQPQHQWQVDEITRIRSLLQARK